MSENREDARGATLRGDIIYNNFPSVRFSIQSAPTKFPQSGNSDVPELLCRKKKHQNVLFEIECFVYWAIQEYKSLAARPICRINSSNIALPGTSLLEIKLLEIENVHNMTQFVFTVIYSLSPLKFPWPPPLGFPYLLGYIQGIFLVMIKIQFILDSLHQTVSTAHSDLDVL